ncbi:hypothetical protein D9M71_530240 [compost metagenome]
MGRLHLRRALQGQAVVQVQAETEVRHAVGGAGAIAQLVFVPGDHRLVEVDGAVAAMQHRLVVEGGQAAPALQGRRQYVAALHAQQAHVGLALAQAVADRQALVEGEQGVAQTLDQQRVGMGPLAALAVTGQAVGLEFGPDPKFVCRRVRLSPSQNARQAVRGRRRTRNRAVVRGRRSRRAGGAR